METRLPRMNEPDSKRTARVVVLTPDQAHLTPEVLTKPFILYALTDHPLHISNVLPLPNVMEVMGGPSGGGGPPGFCCLRMTGNVCEPRAVLIAGFLAGNDVVLHNPYFTVVESLGGVTSTAVVVTYLRLAPVDPEEEEDALELDHPFYSAEGLEQYIKRAGYAPIPLVEYETPEMILNAIKAQPAPAGVPGQ